MKRPDIGVLSDEFLKDVRHMKERNLAVELTQNLRKSVTVDWAKRETVRATSYLPPDMLQLKVQ